MHLSSFFAFLAKNLGLFFSLLPKMLNLPKFMLYWAGERCIISTLGNLDNRRMTYRGRAQMPDRFDSTI